MPKRVLIVTYYWPPSGGSGVQRWVKFVKYLREFDIEPIIYTVKDPVYVFEDPKIGEEIHSDIKVLRRKIFEPNRIIGFFKGKKGIGKVSAGFIDPNPKGFKKRLTQYIRANFFIPDARKFWINPSVRYLKKYLKENPVDAIITTGPPHSLNIIGLKLKRKTGLPWIADFRDPWTEIDYFHHLPFTNRAKRKHERLESEVVREADKTLVIGRTMKDSFDKFSKNVEVITNGYDFPATENHGVKLDEKFSITHIGLMNADRNPKTLWKVLSDLASENKDFSDKLEIKLIGSIAGEVDQELDR